jgi:uncharacterized protein YegP (UPF0339 family)
MHIRTHTEKKSGQSWYTLNARNGAVLMTSETYSTESNMLRAARKVSTALGLGDVRNG